MQNRQNEKTALVKNICMLSVIVVVNIFYVYFSKWFHTLDGDFNAYIWGAKLSGIAEALKQGELRLWNPNIWCGISGIHNFSDSFYPFAILVCKIFWNADKEILSFMAYYAFTLIHSIIATTGFFLVLKELGLNRVVSLFTVLIGGSLVIVNIPYMQLCWIPMFSYLLLKAYKKERVLNVFSVAAGIVFGLFLLQELSQGAVMGVMLMGVLFFTAVYVLVSKEKNLKILKKLFAQFAIAGIIGVCIGAVNLFPILEQQNELLRITVDGFASAAEGVTLDNFYAHPANYSMLREILGARSGISWFGLIPVLLCIMGLFAKENYEENPYRYVALQFGKCLYLFILLASISCYFPEIFFHIPFVNMLRETYLYANLLPFCTTLLSAFGLRGIYDCITENDRRGVQELFYNVPLMCIVCFLVCLQYALANYDNRTIWILLCLLIGIALVILFKAREQAVIAVLLFVSVINFAHIFRYNDISNKWNMPQAQKQYEEVLEGNKRLVDYLDSLSDGEKAYRIMTWAGEEGNFSSNSMVDAGGQYTQGYWEPIYRKTLEMHWNLSLDKRITLNNVLYFVVSENESEEWLNTISEAFLDQHFQLVGTMDNIYPSYNAEQGQPLRIYKNKDYAGNAWLVYDYVKCDPDMSLEDQFSIINDPSCSVCDTALVEVGSPNAEAFLDRVSQPDANASVELINYTNNSIELRCKTENAAILVMAESDAKGWKAYIDGERQEILTVNYGNRGLLVEAGEHNIKMVYSPNGYLIGGILTLVMLLACIVAIPVLIVKSHNH